MRPSSKVFPALVAMVCPLFLVAATCKSEDKARPAPAGTEASAAKAEPSKPAAGPVEVDFAKYGMAELTEAQKDQVRQFAGDELCYCGCPHTLAGCLSTHEACKHGPRQLLLAAALAQMGARSSEIIGELQKYYASFKKEKRVSPDLSGAACKGPENAPVTLVEYSDYECPHCAAARPMLDAFVVARKGQVRLCSKPFPLKLHAHATDAAQAAEFAREKGKYWEMHELLFDNQDKLGLADLKGYAQKLGLDPDALEKAITAGQYKEKVEASKQEGLKFGIDATPTIFVNGRSFVLPFGPGSLNHAVEDELEWQQHGGWAHD